MFLALDLIRLVLKEMKPEMEDRTMLYFVLYNVLSTLLVPVVEAFMIFVMFGKEMKISDCGYGYSYRCDCTNASKGNFYKTRKAAAVINAIHPRINRITSMGVGEHVMGSFSSIITTFQGRFRFNYCGVVLFTVSEDHL
ncbi:hypothetical protein NC651_017925 [Populus alba x Populus x berolinensis]|nr:hypothetical protein NC651_017925 [Populus alba x Populus x berolinensis]